MPQACNTTAVTLDSQVSAHLVHFAQVVQVITVVAVRVANCHNAANLHDACQPLALLFLKLLGIINLLIQ